MYRDRKCALIQLIETALHCSWTAQESKGEEPSKQLARPKALCEGGPVWGGPADSPYVGVPMT